MLSSAVFLVLVCFLTGFQSSFDFILVASVEQLPDDNLEPESTPGLLSASLETERH